MELGLVLTLCGLGAAFLIPALVLEILFGNQKKRCTKSARAVIVGYEASTQGSLRIRYFPAYEYQVDGEKIVSRGTSFSRQMPQKGAEVEIRYNPRKPGQSYSLGYDSRSYRVLSLVFGFMGAIPILICIGIALASAGT